MLIEQSTGHFSKDDVTLRFLLFMNYKVHLTFRKYWDTFEILKTLYVVDFEGLLFDFFSVNN